MAIELVHLKTIGLVSLYGADKVQLGGNRVVTINITTNSNNPLITITALLKNV